jgi:predicted DNA-binding protein
MRLKEEIPSGDRRSHQTEEVMTYASWTNQHLQPGSGVVKTLAIRLEEELHAQLTMIAQLEELTISDAIRQAIESFIETKRSNPQLAERAEAVLADIESDAAKRRGAIATLFSDDGAKPKSGESAGSKTPQRSTRNKGGAPATS